MRSVLSSNLQAINVLNSNLSQIGALYLSNNSIFDEKIQAYDIIDAWSISLQDFKNSDKYQVDNFLYENEILSFSWQRSPFIKIIGNISQFNLQTHFTNVNDELISSKNENSYIESQITDDSLINSMYDYCPYPIPFRYQFSIYSEWIESGINNAYSAKIQGM